MKNPNYDLKVLTLLKKYFGMNITAFVLASDRYTPKEKCDYMTKLDRELMDAAMVELGK